MTTAAANPRNLLTSLILVFPLFLIYQLGVLFTLPMLNGADFVTLLLFQTFGLSLQGYLGFLGGVLCLFLMALLVLRRRQRFDRATIIPVLLESVVWALTMGSVIVFIMTKILGIPPRLAVGVEGQGLLTRFVMSLGAGVYEETVSPRFDERSGCSSRKGIQGGPMGGAPNGPVVFCGGVLRGASSSTLWRPARPRPLRVPTSCWNFLRAAFLAPRVRRGGLHARFL